MPVRISFDNNIGGSVLVGKALENRFAEFLAKQSGSPVSLLMRIKFWQAPGNRQIEPIDVLWMKNGRLLRFQNAYYGNSVISSVSLTILENRIARLEQKLIFLGIVVYY